MTRLERLLQEDEREEQLISKILSLVETLSLQSKLTLLRLVKQKIEADIASRNKAPTPVRTYRPRRVSQNPNVCPTVRKILEHLQGQPEGQTSVQIAESLGVSRSKVSSFLSVLRQAGHISKCSEGRWKASTKTLDGPLHVKGGIGEDVYRALYKLRVHASFSTLSLSFLLKRNGSSLSSTLRSLRSQGVVERISPCIWKVNEQQLADVSGLLF